MLARELRTRMRGARSFWVLFIYIAILSVFLFTTYFTWWSTIQANLNVRSGGVFQVGRQFYIVLFVVQAILVGMITPSLTAGGVSIEKEQRTFDLLTITLMSRRAIVWGKLLSALSFVALLLTASLPLVSLSFLLGGVSPSEVFSAYGLLLTTAFVYGAVGMACSAVARNTTSSTVTTFAVVGILFFSTLVFAIAGLSNVVSPGLSGNNIGLVALNPIGALVAGTAIETYWGITVPAWATALVINGLLGSLFMLVAVHRLDYPRTDRSGLLRLLTAVLVGLLAFCLFGILFTGVNFSETSYITAGIVLFMSLIVLVPVFATGDGLPEPGGVRTLFQPQRLGRGEAPSGVLYVMLVMALCGIIVGAGLRWGPPLSVPLAPVPVASPTPGSAVSVTTSSPSPVLASPPASPDRTKMLLNLVTLAVATAWGFGCFGLFVSAKMRNRWAAMAITGAVMVLIFWIPLSLMGSPNYPTRSLNMLYLTPLGGVVEGSMDRAFANSPGFSAEPPQSAAEADQEWIEVRKKLLFGATPIYLVNSVLALVLGIIFLFLAQAAHRRGEEQFQNALAESEAGRDDHRRES
ncbi:MAG: hypothetical protein OHK0029_27800 [Armatimonadaceae bacterium]